MKKFIPPESGTLPFEGKKVLAQVYEEARKAKYEKDAAARIAWHVVKEKFYELNGKWIKRRS